MRTFNGVIKQVSPRRHTAVPNNYRQMSQKRLMYSTICVEWCNWFGVNRSNFDEHARKRFLTFSYFPVTLTFDC